MTTDTLETATPESTRIGWIGTGVMGSSMAGHVRDAGYELTVHNRTRARADGLIDAGATWADTPAEVAEASDVVFSIVGMPADVRNVILGDSGALAGAGAGTVLVDMTTSEPALAIEIAETAAEKDVHVMDAPVSGGDVGARNGTLSIMAGGPQAVFDAVRPCFDLMGGTVVLQGEHGAGQHTKMANQILVVSNTLAMAEGLAYAYRAGLDVEKVMESVATGAAGSWSLSNLGTRVVEGNFDPGFFVDHLEKDLGIALAECRRLRLALPGLALGHQLYVALQAQGRGRNGTQALVHALASLSSLEWPPAPAT